MGKSERTIETYLVKQARQHNILCMKFTSPGTIGVPDRILIGFGQTVFVETKAEKQQLRQLQIITIIKMINHGAVIYTVNTKEQVDKLINDILNKKAKRKE